MKLIQLNAEISVYDSPKEMLKQDQLLVENAVQATELSYSPYSKFKVGAAVLLENGEIISGANQENASYPLCLCAEQVALHRASVAYPGIKVLAIAVTAISKSMTFNTPPPPCGACRQVIAEYEHRHQHDIRIILGIPDGMQYVIDSAKTILPLHFDPSFLE